MYEKISAARLRTPLNIESPENNPEIEASDVGSVYNLVKDAGGDVVVLVDACAIRRCVKVELREFLEGTRFPVYASPMGKTAIDGDYHRYGSVCCCFPYHRCGGLNQFSLDLYWVC